MVVLFLWQCAACAAEEQGDGEGNQDAIWSIDHNRVL